MVANDSLKADVSMIYKKAQRQFDRNMIKFVIV
jgi:hypothetical protein